jgi:type I restriction enzyme, S subunit
MILLGHGALLFWVHYTGGNPGHQNRRGQPLAALVHVRKGDLEATPIPVPSYPEQQAIAHVLQTVQQAKEATEKVIAASRQLKQSLIRHLFTYGPVPFQDADQVELQETEIGQVPGEWSVSRLGDLLREPLRNGHSAKATNTDQGIRTLTLTAVTQNNFSIENTKLTIADPDKVRSMWLRSGDIFIERANTAELVGSAALYEGPDDFAIFPDLLIRIRVDEGRIVPKFLANFLITPPVRTYYRKNAKKTAGNFPKIDQRIIEQTVVPIPDLNEQREVASSLRAVDMKLHTEANRLDGLRALFDSLLHNFMTGQVRVHDLDLPVAMEVD